MAETSGRSNDQDSQDTPSSLSVSETRTDSDYSKYSVLDDKIQAYQKKLTRDVDASCFDLKFIVIDFLRHIAKEVPLSSHYCHLLERHLALFPLKNKSTPSYSSAETQSTPRESSEQSHSIPTEFSGQANSTPINSLKPVHDTVGNSRSTRRWYVSSSSSDEDRNENQESISISEEEEPGSRALPLPRNGNIFGSRSGSSGPSIYSVDKHSEHGAAHSRREPGESSTRHRGGARLNIEHWRDQSGNRVPKQRIPRGERGD